MRPGVWEIIVIVALIVILFGSAKIPGMMRNLASGIKTFKKEIKDDDKKKPVAKAAPAVAESKPRARRVAKKPVKKTTKKK